MATTVGNNVCPFCTIDTALNKIVYKTTSWNVWENPYPYSRHTNHIVIALKAHVTDVSELLPEAFAELGEILRWAIAEFHLPGGALVMRFGEVSHNAGTLRHLHAHIQVPDGTGPAFAVFHTMTEDGQQDELQVAFKTR
ncbi:MAG: Histidine triad domain protein [Parcubacteria group bacterium]|nr:Histidine triad domain protein [Parcubacteria group bacterium]